MTTEKYLELIVKAMENLKDSDDSYGKTPVEFMQKSGIKSVSDMTFFTDSVGAYLEEIRLNLIADIQASEAKKSGKSVSLAALKKFAKMCEKQTNKPIMCYTHADECGKFVTTNSAMMVISDSSDGLNLKPDSVKGEYFNWKNAMPNASTYISKTMPSASEISIMIKQEKAKNKNVVVAYDFGNFCINAELLELAVRITGSTEISYNPESKTSALYMAGNGHEVVVMPINREAASNNPFSRITWIEL